MTTICFGAEFGRCCSRTRLGNLRGSLHGTRGGRPGGTTETDIVILDISMPGLNGLEAARRIRKSTPATEVLVLSMHYSDQLIREIVDAGVRGYIVKSDSDRDLIIAVELFRGTSRSSHRMQRK